MDEELDGVQLAVQSLAGNPLPAASLGVEGRSPSPTACPPFTPSSLCSSGDVAEQKGDEEEQGCPHAGSLVSVCHGGKCEYPMGGAGGTAPSPISPQGQFDGRAQDPRECPVTQPWQPRAVSLGAEESGEQESWVLGSDA